MSHFARKDEINRALTFLGRQMALGYSEEVTLLCCGGAALCMLEILQRTTKDIDALALVVDGSRLRRVEEFSPEMEKAVSQTARALGLADDWLNGAASVVLDRGLPEGTLQRSAPHARAYGPCLTVQFVDRIDLVALKLYAAMDPTKGRRHETDLVEIQPTEAELHHALKWMLGWKSNAKFKERLAFLVHGLGHPSLAAQIPNP